MTRSRRDEGMGGPTYGRNPTAAAAPARPPAVGPDQIRATSQLERLMALARRQREGAG